MGAIGKALGYTMDLGETPKEKSLGLNDEDLAGALDEGDASAPESETEAPKGGSAEVMAMKMFTKAATPEAKVDALKAFLEACGAIGSSY